jgi:hypothetical protein
MYFNKFNGAILASSFIYYLTLDKIFELKKPFTQLSIKHSPLI